MLEQTLSFTRPPIKNHILNSLSNEDIERLLPFLEFVELPLGKRIYNSDEIITELYFPNTAMVSVIANTAAGECVEAGVIGWEGVVGLNALMGVDSTPHENIVQLTGNGFRIKTNVIRNEFKKSGALHDLILRYMHSIMTQLAQTALCNRLHSIEQRLTRWLLLSRDRSDTDVLALTQEFLSIMLGSNRPSVTVAATHLQSAGFIKYIRGKITILNREGLENFTCDCYQTVKDEIDLMLG